MSSQEQHEESHRESHVQKTLEDCDAKINIEQKLVRMKQKREDARVKAKRVAKEVRNLEKKKTRLMKKAQTLSSNDLLKVYSLRRDGTVEPPKDKQ